MFNFCANKDVLSKAFIRRSKCCSMPEKEALQLRLRVDCFPKTEISADKQYTKNNTSNYVEHD